MKCTKKLSKKRASPASSAKENQRHIMKRTISSAEGFYIYELKNYVLKIVI